MHRRRITPGPGKVMLQNFSCISMYTFIWFSTLFGLQIGVDATQLRFKKDYRIDTARNMSVDIDPPPRSVAAYSAEVAHHAVLIR